MPQFDDKHVKIVGCYVVWDGITRPEQGQDNKLKYSLKVVVDPNSPDMALFHQLANTTLQQSKWAGVLPAGARMPAGQAGPGEFNGMYNGWVVLNCNSQRVPDIYDENAQLLDPMQYGQQIYGGQKVDVLVHCYEYDKAGNKGIATGLDAFAIIASAQAPRQQFGNSGINTAGAFGGNGGGQPIVQSTAAVTAAPVRFDPNTGQPIVQSTAAVTAAPVRFDPNTGQPIVQSNGDYPQQAHNFLPNNQ